MAQLAFDRQMTKIKVLDDQLTPLEIAKVLERDAELPFAIAPLLKSGQKPAAYMREEWSEDASYFTSGRGATRLIVGFSNPAGRLNVPTSYFLQMLRDDVYDLVMLRDPRQLHYTHGIRGLGTFLEAIRKIEDFARSKGYQQVITFGASLGGLPALRAGRLLKARRAVSVGGRYAWHPGRLARNEKEVHAFDPLCACASPSPTELVVVYARGNEVDRSAFELVKKTFPECTPVPIDIEKHGIFNHFHKARLLPLFVTCLLDYWDDAQMRSDLLAQLQQTARHSLLLESLKKKHTIRKSGARMREWLHLLTQPVTSLRRPTPVFWRSRDSRS
jgi:hypothetical protein